MKSEYQWARRIIVILTAIVFIVLLCGSFGNGFFELLPLAGVFVGVAWLACFLSMGISRKMIQIGDKLPNLFLRVLYYALFMPLVLAVWVLIWFCIESAIDSSGGIYARGEDPLGDGLLALFWGAVFLVILLVPYIQSLLVLLLHKVLKKTGEEAGQENVSE